MYIKKLYTFPLVLARFYFAQINFAKHPNIVGYVQYLFIIIYNMPLNNIRYDQLFCGILQQIIFVLSLQNS